ncbi:hypothetical protein ACFE04_031134 [Oxalis oulophora]
MVDKREQTLRLHNFTMPQTLNWGTQKQFKCVSPANIYDSDHVRLSSGTPHRRKSSNSKKLSSSASLSSMTKSNSNNSSRMRGLRICEEDEDYGVPIKIIDATVADTVEEIGVFRERMIKELRRDGERLQNELFRGKLLSSFDEPPPPPPPPPPPVAERPWNLRTRRAPHFVVGESNSSGYFNDGLRFGEDHKKKGLLLNSPKKLPERLKFSLTLSKKEIEEDFIKMTGHKPPRRPKRRSKTVQRQIDAVCPGMWLGEVNVDAYKVVHPPEPEWKTYNENVIDYA